MDFDFDLWFVVMTFLVTFIGLPIVIWLTYFEK